MPAESMPQMVETKPTLYSKDILRLAASLPFADRLSDADAQATKRSPVCGSEIGADLKMDATGHVAAIAFRARACAMGQASAALLRDAAIGRSAVEIAEMRNALAAALAGQGAFESCWPEYACFAPARAHPGRHAAILLPFDALLAAAEAV